MKCSFINWYTQALGATLGIISCIYAYLNGYMFVYTNINRYFDELGINGVISSYFLLPLCTLTLILGVMRSYLDDKKFFNISLDGFSKVVSIVTVIIGFLGAKIYFTIPAILILFNIYSSKINLNPEKYLFFKDKAMETDDKVDASALDNICENGIITNNELMFDEQNTIIFYKKDSDQIGIFDIEKKQLEKNSKVSSTRIEIALDLLSKNAGKQFIMEITGFSLKEIEKLDKELNDKKC